MIEVGGFHIAIVLETASAMRRAQEDRLVAAMKSGVLIEVDLKVESTT